MIIIRGLSLYKFSRLKEEFTIDDNRTRIIDINSAVVDVELPKGIRCNYLDDDSILLYTVDCENLLSLSSSDIEFIEIK